MKVIVLLLICIAGINFTRAQFFQQQSVRCQNPNGRSGTCVSIYDCQTVMSVLQRQPRQAIDLDFVRSSECRGGFGRSPHVCCTSDTGFTRQPDTFDEDNWESPPRRTVLFPSDNSRRAAQRGGRRDVGAASTAVASTASLLPQPPTCGGVTIENKIYGGSNADLYEFPWMVLFEYNRRSGGGVSINCAGSLINQRYVLTAAHCVTGAIEKVIGQLVTIRLGEHDTSSQTDCNQFSCNPEILRVGIDQVIPHELYKDTSANKEHDIGLVRLDRNVRYADNIRPICLPSAMPQEQPVSGTKYTVAGWGRTLKAAKSPVKQKLSVSLVDQQQCVQKFNERKVRIADTQLCAGGKFAEDSCEGDSGGPLMRFRSGAWVLEGVVSFGYKCGLKDWPAVHTRVASYTDWILRNIRA